MDLKMFRAKVVLPSQREMFANEPPLSSLLRQAILEKPTDISGKRGRWHIGNVEQLGPDGLYFALGRTTRSARTVLDPETGNFVESEYENAPYTHVLLDIPHEVLAIARKTSLARHTTTLAHKLERVLAASDFAQEHHAGFRIQALSDPREFLESLRTADEILSFTVTFSRPNPFDVEGDFLRPMQRLVEAADGREGSATLKGHDLNEAPLEELATSAAATGDDARARIVVARGQKPVARTLRGESVSVTHDDLSNTEERQAAVEKVRAKYERIRKPEE